MAKQLRITYGEALAELGESDRRIVVVDADMAEGTRTIDFKKRFPRRFFDVGIAEQNLVGVGAGLSLTGLISFVNTFAWLLTLRAGDPVRTLVAYANTNVKLAAGYGGFSGPMDGASHESITDIAVMRAMPGLVVLSMGDHWEVKMALQAVTRYVGPVYLRLSRAAVDNFHSTGTNFEIGRGIILREGPDILFITTGPITGRVIEASGKLARKGIDVEIIEIHTIKPLDKALILREAKRIGRVITVEEHSVIGGLGSAVCELLSETSPLPVRRMGINDTFGETGPYEELLDLYGLSVDDLVKAATDMLEKED